MSERPNFGHHGAHGFGTFIDAWGDGPLLIRSGRRKWWFEFSDMFGPTWLNETDKEPSNRQPTDERDPFWPVFNAWMRAGKRCRAIRTKRGKVKYWLCHAPKREMLR